VTSVIFVLEFGCQKVLTILYQELSNDSITTLIELYEAWNKPEKAEEWRAKLQQSEAVDK